MERKRVFGAAGTAVLVLALTGTLLVGRRPFRNLEAADIQTASVRLVPPDTTVQLDRVEIGTLADLLREVRVTRQDDSYRNYCGQSCVFTLTMTDGTAAEINACSPFLIIDGVGWRTAYAPCEALDRFANQLP